MYFSIMQSIIVFVYLNTVITVVLYTTFQTSYVVVPKECLDTKMGLEYRGQVSVTESGRVCSSWGPPVVCVCCNINTNSRVSKQ